MPLLKRLCGLVFLCAASSAAAALYGLIALYIYLAHDLPDVRLLREPGGFAKLMAQPEFSPPAFRPARFEELPLHVINAFLAAWQPDFFTGASPRTRTDCGNVLFPQLARRLLPEQRRSPMYSARQAILMFHLDVLLTREEIFTGWLNAAYFGNGKYGLEAAARFYFGKPASELRPAEAAALACMCGRLPRNPLRDPAWLRNRRDYVLQRMKHLDWLSQEDYEQSLAEPVVFVLYRGTLGVRPEQP